MKKELFPKREADLIARRRGDEEFTHTDNTYVWSYEVCAKRRLQPKKSRNLEPKKCRNYS